MKIRLFAAVSGAALLVAAAVAARAGPVPDHERAPLDLRRTTLVVQDIDRSLAFYRDALGMKVIYDNPVMTPRGASLEQAEVARRLVLLRANDDYIGVVGLLQYLKPKKDRVELAGTSFMEGTAVLIFNVEDLPGTFERVRKVEGVEVIGEPKRTSFPSYDGASVIDVMVSTVQDPDGFTVEVNQLLGELR